MNINLLRAELIKNGMTQAELAVAIGIHPSTLSRKFRQRDCGLDEAKRMIEVLHIENPAAIFFDR